MTPKLPIIDGCLFVDNSIKDIFTTCPKAGAGDYYWRHHRSLASEGVALRYGEIVHQALALRNHQLASNGHFNEPDLISLLVREFSNRPCESEGWRNLDAAIKLIRSYNVEYPACYTNFIRGAKHQKRIWCYLTVSPTHLHEIYHYYIPSKWSLASQSEWERVTTKQLQRANIFEGYVAVNIILH